MKELKRVIKEKKQVVPDTDLQLKKYERDMQAPTKERTAAVNFVANLEEQYGWMMRARTFLLSLFCF